MKILQVFDQFIWSTRKYNKADKLTELRNVKSNGDVISSFEYGYNWNGNIVSVTNKHGNTTHYNYDKESRLTSVEYPGGSKMKYKYDKKDNLLEKKRIVDGEVVSEVNNEYDEENRLIRSDGNTYSYDKDGNQIRAGDISFDYMTSFVNGKNVKRLKSVYDSDEHVASYSYTLEGQRTGKYLHDGDSKISYHYNGRNVQYEQWSSGRTVRYTHPIEGGSSCSSCGCGGSSGVFTDHPISIEFNGTKYYYLYNGQGSVTELINADEEVVNKYRYTPFGSPRLKVESVYNPYEYTGRRLDEETGQYYYRARMYSTEQCRFTTQDPAGIKQGPNMYAYVGNNPVNHRDPSGLIAPDAVIDGGGGGSSDPCYQLPGYDSIQECMQDWSYDYCVEHCYEDGNYDEPGGGHIDLPSGVKCVLANLAVNAVQHPTCYWLCGGALKSCWYLTSPTAITICLGAGCACAAPDVAWAIADCT